ncbi:MAG: hypothetical protein WAQ99_17845 [Pyrinomonadaceae bacterium]
MSASDSSVGNRSKLSSANFPTAKVIALGSSLIVFALSYLAAVSNSFLPDRWRVGCCGKEFWWGPVGASIVLVAAALLLRLKTAWGYFFSAFLGIWVFCASFSAALSRWFEYFAVNKTYAFQQALLPIYRPLALVVSLYIVTISVRRLFRLSPR